MPASEAPPKRKIGTKQIIAFVFGIVIVVAIFVFAIPRFADYGEVWAAMKTLTPIETLSLIAATVFNLFTYWLANQAAMTTLTGRTQPSRAASTSATVRARSSFGRAAKPISGSASSGLRRASAVVPSSAMTAPRAVVVISTVAGAVPATSMVSVRVGAGSA